MSQGIRLRVSSPDPAAGPFADARLTARIETDAILCALGKPEAVLRVYLDQNKWVDLAHSAARTAKGVLFQDAYAAATRAAAQRSTSFPLSAIHIDETCRIRRLKWRHDVAFVMIRLSRRDSIARWQEITEVEIDRALHQLCGRPAEPPQTAPFGTGLAFACGGETEDRNQPHHVEAATAEFLALAAGDSTAGFRQQTADRFQGAKDFAEALQQMGPKLNEGRRRVGDDRAFVSVATSLLGNRVAQRGLFNDVPPIGLRGVDTSQDGRVLRQLPSVGCLTRLILLKQANPQSRWDAHDLNDLKALGIAAVYCDVAIAEKGWISYLRRVGAHQAFGTQLVSDLRLLPDLLTPRAQPDE